jgi:hypothetical protein
MRKKSGGRTTVGKKMGWGDTREGEREIKDDDEEEKHLYGGAEGKKERRKM